MLLPLCDQARPWFRFSKRTSSVAGLALCLVAFSRASLVVLFCGENGTAVLSNWALTLGINTRVMDRSAIEPNRTESQVRSRRLELRSWKSEVGGWKSEEGNRKLEVRSGKWEVGSGKWKVESGKWQVRRSSHSALSLSGQKSEIRSAHFVKFEVWSLKYEVLSLKSEVWSRKSEVGSRKSEVGSRKSEVGRPSSAFVVVRSFTNQVTVGTNVARKATHLESEALRTRHEVPRRKRIPLLDLSRCYSSAIISFSGFLEH